MKHALRLFCTVLVLVSCNRQPKEPPVTLRLPITIKEGYGPFYPGFGILSADWPTDPIWGKTYYPVRGIPRHWSSPVRTRVIVNFQQFVYQHVKTGNLEQALYDTYSKAPGWTSDTNSLSTKPIKCYVNVVRGFDEHVGKWAILVDTDNDLDFADEAPVYPEFLHPKEIDYKIKDQRIIQYELYKNGRVETARAPVVFRYTNTHFLYSFPRYATAVAQVAGKQYDLLIDPHLSRLNFEASKIALASSIGSNGRVDGQKLIEVGDEIELGGIAYRNNGISPSDNTLELEPVSAVSAQTNPLQNGREFQPFTDTEFISGKPIDLQKQRGKYVFIDFWHTGCRGCVEDMPNLNAIYQRADKRKLAFIGINCGDSPERLRTFLQKKQVKWPQILSTDKNDYYQKYRVSGFPTSVLLDPQGKIIARDLPSHALDEKLAVLFYEKRIAR
ncbi:TlpA disulfide reductase family protein [uncultured Spirosoma sp.]|uniref:TlpA family protein disulfide reductase n=1 Tax=uncultured Spirosoma sp. TaxID=278208 RepID=UPI00259027A0|nr:TlpA disulfide reductase family protein [uncultured Spirosoma sp.]